MNILPVACTLDVTEECNLRCDYCFTHTKSHKKRTLDFKLGCDIIKWMLNEVSPKEPMINISYWGGEPLLEWDMCKELTYYAENIASEKGFYDNIQFGGTTNGILYTPDKVEWCIEHKSLFLVSLDGIQPAHDFHRKLPTGKGSWKLVDKNIREAIKIAPYQKIRFSFSADTVKYLSESIKYFTEDLSIYDTAFSAVFESNWDEAALATMEEQLEIVIDYMIKRHKEGNPIIVKHLNDEACFKHNGLSAENPCGAGSGYSGWSVDGFQYPCHRFNKHGLSTKEREESKVTIGRMLNEKYIELHPDWRKQFYQFKDNPPEKCIACSIYRFSGCNGGCYGVNFDMTGDLYEPPENVCNYNKLINKMGLLLREKAEKEKIIIPMSGWNAPVQNETHNIGCVCYNMCYAEGTKEEIIHIDRRNDTTCMCYQTQYMSSKEEKNSRTIQMLDSENELKKRFLDLSKRILQTKDVEKSEEQVKMELDIIQKTIDII